MNVPNPDIVAAIVTATLARAAELQRLPQSTYRVQFHKDFGFRDAAAIVPYLADLGITHLYASPYLKAVPGSTHGYDVIDPTILNPELGTVADYDALLNALRRHGMTHILDTVPNHMGVSTNENAFWNDVLENGRASKYADYFDIAWDGSPRASLRGRVLLPSLGTHYGQALEKGELRLTVADGTFVLRYYDWSFPISPATYGEVLGLDIDRLKGDPSAKDQFRSLIDACASLGADASTEDVRRERHGRKEEIKRRLRDAIGSNESIRRHIHANLATINGKPGDAASFDLLDRLLSQQHYRLAYWKTAPDEINYRRFFDVNPLAALQMENEAVFRDVHRFTLDLLADGKVAGLRVDHPDGLYDPAEYFRRLQSHFLLAVARRVVHDDPAYANVDWSAVEPRLLAAFDRSGAGDGSLPMTRWPLYVLGEKILAMDEPLPRGWALHGTSGYDFLNFANGLFVDGANADRLTSVYEEFTGQRQPFEDLIYDKKKLILQNSLASELQMLTLRLDKLAQRDRHSADFTLSTLKHALTEVIACFPVYRSYIADQGEISATDERRIESAVDAAIARNPTADPAAFHFVRDTLLLRFGGRFTHADRADQRRFAGKFQQLTSPATAKGIEDTAFYIYNRLLSLNEVGAEPSHFGVPPGRVHAYFAERQRDWPLAMSTLSTHDTKRSEDVRARLNVLSELPAEWAGYLRAWGELNAAHRTVIAGQAAPDRNDEHTLYQTLLGGWPMSIETDAERAEWVSRVKAFMVKAMREAKVHTAWTNTNADYESAVDHFIDRVLSPATSAEFLRGFDKFQRKVSHYGMINSLAQSLVKLTAPGVPDTYQGTERWDLSLVDPDNRRRVDFEIRRQGVASLLRQGDGTAVFGTVDSATKLIASVQDGRIKQFVHLAALRLRRAHPGLFTHGTYLPLQVTGERANHLFAFARQRDGRTAIVMVPRLPTSLCGDSEMPVGDRTWGDTVVDLSPLTIERATTNVFTGETLKIAPTGGRNERRAAEVLSHFPVALLIA